jgi:hypothetical protein
MTDTAESVANARRMFTEHHGMLRTTDAIRLGIHPRTLYTLRDSGELEQLGRGLYRLRLQLPSPVRTSFQLRFAFREQLSV